MQYTYFVSSKETGSIRSCVNRICDVLDGLYEQLNTVSLTISALEAQGVTEGKIHWRRRPFGDQPGILELLHPQESEYTRKAGRRREYIGTDPEKQQEAFAKIKRWKTLQEAKSEQRRIRDKMAEIERQISRLELIASGKQTAFRDAWFAVRAGRRPEDNK